VGDVPRRHRVVTLHECGARRCWRSVTGVDHRGCAGCRLHSMVDPTSRGVTELGRRLRGTRRTPWGTRWRSRHRARGFITELIVGDKPVATLNSMCAVLPFCFELAFTFSRGRGRLRAVHLSAVRMDRPEPGVRGCPLRRTNGGAALVAGADVVGRFADVSRTRGRAVLDATRLAVRRFTTASSPPSPRLSGQCPVVLIGRRGRPRRGRLVNSTGRVRQ